MDERALKTVGAETAARGQKESEGSQEQAGTHSSSSPAFVLFRLLLALLLLLFLLYIAIRYCGGILGHGCQLCSFCWEVLRDAATWTYSSAEKIRAVEDVAGTRWRECSGSSGGGGFQRFVIELALPLFTEARDAK